MSEPADDDGLIEYHLGGGGDHDPAAAARTRRSALVGLGVVAVVVALAITLTALLVDTSPAAPAGPQAAARAWATALVQGDRGRRQTLECAQGSPSGRVLALVTPGATGARADAAIATGPDQWSVPITFLGAGGTDAASADVTVVLEDGRYLVC